MDINLETMEAIQGLLESQNRSQRSLLEHGQKLTRRCDEMEARLGCPNDGYSDSKAIGNGSEYNYKSVGSRMIESSAEMLDGIKRHKHFIFAAGNLHPSFEQKTLLDSVALGRSTPGILGAQAVSGIVSLARRRLTIRDLMRTKKVTEAQMSFIKETTATYLASPVSADGAAKAESTTAFSISSSICTTIAHYLNLSLQALDDLPELRRFIDESLIYGLKLKEEGELFSGDSLGSHLSGVATQAGAYSGTYTAAGDTKLDTLRHYIAELADLEEQPTGIVMHPATAQAIDLLKTEEGGANKGVYIAGDPLGGSLTVRTYWGLPAVLTRTCPSNKVLVGDFSKAIIGDRMDCIVEASREHASNFTENKITILAEERIGLAVLRPAAFKFGSI